MLQRLSRQSQRIRRSLSSTSSRCCLENSSRYHSEEEGFPHAETSAAGAARNERLHRRALRTTAHSLHSRDGHGASAQSFPSSTAHELSQSQPTSKHRAFHPRQRKAKPFRQGFNQALRKDIRSLNQRFLEWQSTTPQAGHMAGMVDIGWKTPAELAGGATSNRLIRDVELIKRCLWRNRLLHLFEMVRPIFLRLQEGRSFSSEVKARRRDLRNATLNFLAAIPREQTTVGALFPADITAFHVVGAILVETQTLAGLSDGIIHKTLLGMKSSMLRPMTLPSLHRLVSTAGRAKRYELVEFLYEYAYTAWDESTDEWMLYARGRAIAHSQGIDKLNRYWEVYREHRLAPPQAYGDLMKFPGAQRKELVPPSYLFTFIAKSQAELGKDSRAEAAKETLQAMRLHGYPVNEPSWLSRLTASPSLRLQLPSIFSPTLAPRAPELLEESLPLQLLRHRVHALDLRDVYRLARIMRIPLSTRVAHREQKSVVVQEPPIQSIEQRKALAIIGQLFGRLGSPERAYGIFNRLFEEEAVKGDENSAGMAATGVITAYDTIGHPNDALKFGKRLFFKRTPYKLRPTTHILGALLRSAAALADLQAAVKKGHWIESLMIKRNLPFDAHICKGLAAYLFSLSRRAPSDRHGIRMIVRTLVSMAEKRHHVEKSLSPESERRLMLLLYELRKTGIEEHLHTLEVRLSHGGLTHMVDEPLFGTSPSDALEDQDLRQHEEPIPPPNTPLAIEYADWAREAEALFQRDLVQDSHVQKQSQRGNRETNRLMQSSGYAIRARDLSGIRRDHSAAADLIQGMIARGIRPSMYHLAPLVEGLCLDGRVDDAMLIVRDAQWETGTLTTPRIEVAILRALLQAGRRDDAQAEFSEWCQGGGDADTCLRSLFNEDGRPSLASEAGLATAVAESEQSGESLGVRDVGDAFRWLMRHRKPKSAQHLVLEATLTGMKWDSELRKAVRDSGSWMRKVIKRSYLRLTRDAQGGDKMDSDDDGERETSEDDEASEVTLEDLTEALEVHQQAMDLGKHGNPRNNPQWASTRDRNRRAILDLICGFVQVKPSGFGGREAFDGKGQSE